VDVENGSFLPVAVRSVLAGAGCFSGSGQGEDMRVQRVGGHQGGRLEWVLKAPRRGVYRIGPPLTETGDALGLFFQRTARDPALEIVIYPRRFPISSFPWQARELFGSLRAEGLIEDPVNTIGTREYQPGRPSRFLHWKASARLGKMQEKLYEPTSHRKVLFVLDVRGYLDCLNGEEEQGRERGKEAFETCLEALGGLVLSLMETGASFGLITNAHIRGGIRRYLDIGRGPEHAGALLEILARLQLKSGESLEELVYEIGRSGTGFIYMGYAPDSRSRIFFSLPAAQRRKIFFLFSTQSGEVFESPVDTPPRDAQPGPEVEPPPELFQGYPAALVEDIFNEN